MRRKLRATRPKPRVMDQEKAREVLFEVRAVLERCGVPFFLILGTCLGVVREGQIIPHDIDIDLGVRVEDLRPKMPALIEAFTAAGYAARVHEAPCDAPRALTVTRDGIKCDIAGFFKRDGVRFSPSAADDYCLVYAAEFFDSLEEREAYGVAWPVPSTPERYLAYHYGPTWRTPDPGWKPKDGPARKYGFRVGGGG